MSQTYQYRLYRDPADLEQCGWQAFVQQHAQHDLADLAFLRAINGGLADSDRCFFLTFSDAGGRLMACAVFSLFYWDPFSSAAPRKRPVLGLLRRQWPNFCKLPLLLCGAPASLGDNLLVVDRQADKDALAAALASALEQLGRDCRCSISLVTESCPGQLPLLEKLLGYGYQLAPSPPYYFFPSDFGSFDDYCHALQAKYRANVLRAQRHFHQAGFVIRHVQQDGLTEAFDQELYQLYLAVVNASAYRFEVLRQRFFLQLIEHKSQQLILTLALKDGQKVGFILSMYSGRRFYLLFAGLDYQANQQTNVYYNLVYAAIEQALAKGPFDSIHVGQAADTFKARLGCRAVPMTLMLRARTAFSRRLLDWFGKELFTLAPPQPPYRVFKSGVERCNSQQEA